MHRDHQVYVAMLIILLLAGAITGLKMYLVQQFGPTPDPKYDEHKLSQFAQVHKYTNTLSQFAK